MTTHLTGGAPALNERDEQARRAVKAFRALQPTLSAYARVLTKRSDVRVEMAAADNGSTDGKRIFYRPPLALGDATEHDRNLCDRRDENKQLLCPACKIRERVLVPIYHEIAHIAWESFAPPSESDKVRLVKEAVAGMDSEYARKIQERIEKAPYYKKESYVALTGLVNEFLPLILNSLEDARINAAQFEARKGTKVMFAAEALRVFTEGVEQKDPVTGEIIVKGWKEYPQNMQFIVGLYCKASGYDYSDWFIPPVVEALNDVELTKLVKQLHTVRSARGVYEMCFPILAKARELGYCKDKRNDPPEPEPEPEESDESDESDEADQSESGKPTDSDESEKSGGKGDSSGESDEPSESGETESKSDSDGEADEEGEPDTEGEANEEGEPDTEGEANEEGEPDTEGEAKSGPAASPRGSDTDDFDFDDSDESDESSSGDESSEQGEADGQSGQSPPSEMPTSDESDEDGQSDDAAQPEKKQKTAETESNDDSDDELIDTGADEGEGGTELIEDEKWDHIPLGEPDDMSDAALEKWMGHEKPKSIAEERQQKAEKEAVDRAIIQGIYFETPSRVVNGVRIHRYGHPVIVDGLNMSRAWSDEYRYLGYSSRAVGRDGNYETPESILGRVLLKMRVAFSDNQRGKYVRHQKTGKVDASVLGKRAFRDDERLFRRKLVPGKRDYFVVIGLDVSGSTVGVNIDLIKRAAFAQASLLHRMGITFAMYAHTGNYASPAFGRGEGFDLDIYVVKEADEPWSHTVQKRLVELGPDSANLDGHSLEFYRKLCDTRRETDKVILYFSDGKMPAENFTEELEILQREIRICKSKGYTLLGVGIRTDSPARHGLETVEIHEVADLHKVVDQLGKHLMMK